MVIPSLTNPVPGGLVHWSVPHAIYHPISMLSFWFAIGLPAIYIPLLAIGIDSTSGLVVFLALFGFHILTLFVGRHYLAEIRS